MALALTILLRVSPGKPEDLISPLHQLEHGLQPWAVFLIVPVSASPMPECRSAECIGVPPQPGAARGRVGIVRGQAGGVFAFSWVAIRMDCEDLPANATWAQFYGVALLCGIGASP